MTGYQHTVGDTTTRRPVPAEWDGNVLALLDRPAWQADAACRGQDPDLFFTEGAIPAEAKKICAECPVQVQCLDYALAIADQHGTWGGMSERGRRRERARRRRNLKVAQ